MSVYFPWKKPNTRFCNLGEFLFFSFILFSNKLSQNGTRMLFNRLCLYKQMHVMAWQQVQSKCRQFFERINIKKLRSSFQGYGRIRCFLSDVAIVLIRESAFSQSQKNDFQNSDCHLYVLFPSDSGGSYLHLLAESWHKRDNGSVSVWGNWIGIFWKIDLNSYSQDR